MTIFNSMNVNVLIILLIAGAMIGLFTSGPDLLNPVTSQAEAERMRAETRHLDAMNQFEEQLTAAKAKAEIDRIHHEMDLEEARYQAELARIAADQAHYERMLEIKANLYEAFMTLLVILAGALGTMLILIGTKVALQRIHVPAAAALSTANHIAPAAHPRRHSPNGYEQMRIQARQRELFERAIMLRHQDAAAPSISKMTSKQYHDLPLAR